MQPKTVGHCEASMAMRTPGELLSPRGCKLNKALRGVALCLALGIGAASLPAIAEVRIFVQAAPPPLLIEEVPAARRGHVWAPGHWRWHKRQHVWARGHWERERRGHRYESARWEQRGHRYQFAPGHWQRDSNRSGRNPMRGGQRQGVQQ